MKIMVAADWHSDGGRDERRPEDVVIVSEYKDDPANPASLDQIRTLIEDLRSHDPGARLGARRSLEEIGAPAVPFLVRAVHDPDWHVRWDSMKALAYIADPSSAQALVDAMCDDWFGIRWLAASALIQLGPLGLPALLEGLTRHGESILFRSGARRVLTEVIRRAIGPELKLSLRPLLIALESGPAIDAPVVARTTLDSLAA
jgi:HEAT repeat protein